MRLIDCPVRAAVNVIDGKWKPMIVNALKSGALRFGQLRRQLPDATRKVLTDQLRELEEDQIISRKISGPRSQRVEYAVSPYGKTLVSVLTVMAEWGKKHKKLKPTNSIPRQRASPK